MIEWEHLFIQISGEAKLINRKLNEWGEQGWEVVGFAPTRQRHQVAVSEWAFTLKRPKHQ